MALENSSFKKGNVFSTQNLSMYKSICLFSYLSIHKSLVSKESNKRIDYRLPRPLRRHHSDTNIYGHTFPQDYLRETGRGIDANFGTRSKTEIPISRIQRDTTSLTQRGLGIDTKKLYINNTIYIPTKHLTNQSDHILSSYDDNLDMREPPSAVPGSTSTASKINSGIQQQYSNSQQVTSQNARGGFPPPPTAAGGNQQQQKQVAGSNQYQGGQQPPSIPQLQDMARRQQQQIEAQQQLLVAKEQRLKYLRQQDYRHHQMAAEYERLRRLREKVKVDMETFLLMAFKGY